MWCSSRYLANILPSLFPPKTKIELLFCKSKGPYFPNARNGGRNHAIIIFTVPAYLDDFLVARARRKEGSPLPSQNERVRDIYKSYNS